MINKEKKLEFENYFKTSMLYPELSNRILGIAMQLHREMGSGFREKVYQDAFEVLLKENNITYEKEKHIDLVFHGVKLEHDFYYDFLRTESYV